MIMKIHYSKAGNGCKYARFPTLYRNIMVTDDMNKVTCAICKDYIKKRNLRYRYEFSECPTFKPKRKGEFAIFQCPVCGIRHSHGWASGHRVSHCDCWESGYYLDCSSGSIPQTSKKAHRNKPHGKSNVITFLPPLTFNGLFLRSFVNEEPPCAALGVVETAGREKGFIALKAEKEISNYHEGFDLGTQLLGNNGFAVLHMILNFNEDNVYDVLLNPGAPATKRVMRLWKETRDYFFFVIKDGGLTAFHQELDTSWYEYDYFGVMELSKNTESQYDRAVRSFKKNKMGHGTFLYMNYQDNTEFLNLKENRFEAKPNR
jgi:hypothetical protein